MGALLNPVDCTRLCAKWMAETAYRNAERAARYPTTTTITYPTYTYVPGFLSKHGTWYPSTGTITVRHY